MTVTTALTPVTVLGDEVMLARMVSNLVGNAVRYNVPGGSVHIEVDPKAGLTVGNSGPRVSAETAGTLFEPFRNRSADGAGLGLSIVAAIARAHDGTVTLRPNPDGGLTVRVNLPPHPA